MAVMAVSEVARTDAGKKAINDTVTALKVAILVAGGIFIAKYGYGKYKIYRAKKYARENGNKPEVQTAFMLYNAMIGNTIDLGFFEIDIPNGTDESTLNYLALNCDFISVSKAYKTLFDRDLLTDVNNELDSAELRVFFNRLRSKGSDVTTPTAKLQPYPVNTTLYCRNKNGITLLRADEKNGVVKVTNENMGNYEYGKEIGTIKKIVKNTDGEIFYMIDRAWKNDYLFGYGYANHRDVLNKNPDTK